MNVYRNKLTGEILEIPSEFGSNKVWEKVSPAPAAKVKAETKEADEVPKKTAKRTVKK